MKDDQASVAASTDSRDWPAVNRWRRAKRAELIEQRLALPATERTAMAKKIAAQLDATIGDPGGHIVGLYWPFRGEPDLRFWLASLVERGATTALPVVVDKGKPLAFFAYRPGDKLRRGVWNIPCPADETNVIPDIVVSPLVGFDRHKYRLGYGGGFYDRTLAAFATKPLTIGVGYASSQLETIHPQVHDIAMDQIVLAGA